MTRRTQTNFRAQDFMVASTKDKLAKRSAPAKKAEPGGDAVPDGTTEEVIAWVGDDKDRAKRALDKENAGDNPRVTLVEPLEKVLEPDEAPDDKGADEGDKPAAEPKKAPAKRAAKKTAASDK